MRHGTASTILNRIVMFGKIPSFNAALTIGLVAGGPLLVFATFYAMKPIQGGTAALRFILTADLIYVLFITTLLIRRLVQIASARRAQSAGSRLHFRLTTTFGVIALFPTVLVAIFAMLSLVAGFKVLKYSFDNGFTNSPPINKLYFFFNFT